MTTNIFMYNKNICCHYTRECIMITNILLYIILYNRNTLSYLTKCLFRLYDMLYNISWIFVYNKYVSIHLLVQHDIHFYD